MTKHTIARTFPWIAAAWLLTVSMCLGAEPQDDTDNDGIRDEHEQILGTDPQNPEMLQVVLDDGPQPEARREASGYDPSKDILQVEFCHVGGDRYLWRATFAAPPKLEDTVFHLYIDADADDATGRSGSGGAASTGTEYMLSVVGGRGSSGFYDAEGSRSSGPYVAYVVDGNSLLVSSDVELQRDGDNVRYGLYVLCHTRTEDGGGAEMSDSTGKHLIEDVPLTDRPKIMRPADHTENYRVQAAFGHELLKEVLAAPDTTAVRHDQLQLDGYEVDLFTSRRWPHVRLTETDGSVATEAPKAGRYHVGFMMYDDSNDERIGVSIDGQLQGVAVAGKDNNTTWLYWLDEPYEFEGGERVQLKALGNGGKHGICNTLFLESPPDPRDLVYEASNLVAASPVGHTGRVTVSWTTSWPCSTEFQYGTDSNYGETVQANGNSLVHRVVLEGLDPQREYHGRAVGKRRDGSVYYSEDFVFRATPPDPPPTRSDKVLVPLTVENPHETAVANWPITAGVPFPKGELASSDHVRLLNSETEVPAQVRVTARWPDGSVKWLLVTFQADVAAEGTNQYRLEYGSQVERAAVDAPLVVREQETGVAIDTGALQLSIDRHGNIGKMTKGERPLLKSGEVCSTVARDDGARGFSTENSMAETTVEESGPLRAVVKVTSWLTDSKGARLMRIEKWVMAYRQAPLVRIEHTFVLDQPRKFTRIEELSYRVPVRDSGGTWSVPTVGGKTLTVDGAGEFVRQRFDRELVARVGDKEKASAGRVVGSMDAGGPEGCAVALRDFWQNYPKAFSLEHDGLAIELCPDFDAGHYDQFPFEEQGHQLYYYLLDGRYRLKRGVSKTHEMLLCFDEPDERRAACAAFQRPLLATASPEWYCESEAFYAVAPRDTEKFRLYEQAIDENVAAYAERRERQQDFGMLNYGDWYGERGTNWGNIEYDTQHAFFLEYIRSGNPDAFFLGEAAELHNRDIDTVRWSEDPDEIGAVYVHQMCHVGDYYDRPVPGSLGFPSGGYTVSHAWTEGHFDHYFLTGDRRSYETGCAVADFFTRKELGRPYDFSSCRTPGWHLIMLAAAYAATSDPYYLNAAKVVVGRVLETQDVQPRPLPDYQSEGRRPVQQGGWARMMVPGHCRCEPRHRGNAGFMVAVLLSGLKYYHDVTGDPEVKKAIIRGARYLLEETYSDEVQGFRYTSCPETGYRPGASPLMAEGIARAYLWTGEERLRRMLSESLPVAASGSSYGKGFSMYYRMAPRLLADLDAAGIRLDTAASEE